MSSIPHSRWGLACLPGGAAGGTILFCGVTGETKRLEGQWALHYTASGWAWMSRADAATEKLWVKDLLSITVFAAPSGRLLRKLDGKATWLDGFQTQFQAKYKPIPMTSAATPTRIKVYKLAAPYRGCLPFLGAQRRSGWICHDRGNSKHSLCTS